MKIIQKVQPNKGKDLSYCYRIYGDLEKERNLNIKNIDEFTTNNRKKLLKAIQWYKKGLEALDYPEDISGSFTEFQFCASKIDCIELLKLIADSYFELQKNEQTEQSSYYREYLQNSLKYYNQAGDVIQQVRAEISGEESKIQLTELEKTTFHKSIQTAFLAYSTFQDDKYLNIAFQNSERTKSSAVFDQLNQQEAIDNSVIPDSILLKEKEINQKIAVYQQKILEEKNLNSPSNSLIEVYNSELFELIRTKQELMLLLETDFKDYSNLKYSNSMLTVTDIQKRLKKNEVLLEYVLEENEAIVELYTFIITPGNAMFLKQELEKSWLADIERVFRFTSSKEYQYVTGKQSVEFCLASHNLYKKLILPCQDFIKDKKLIIIPDGKINYVAFDALLTALPDTSQRIRFNELKYLVKDYCTNHGFSANLLYAFQGKKEKQKVKVKAFAPSYSGESYQFGNQEIKLTPLTGTIQEVDAISTMLNTEKFINEDATESNFRKHAADSEILHLAMHAYINDSIPALSRFAFAKPGETMPQNDGWLTTIDIYNLELNCRMVVLSACNTGTGALRKGEGVMSLARGFLFAGCPSIVMTLWEVEDKSGAEIMQMFYRNIKKGKPKDEALRLSKLHFLENSNSRMAHPHYWLGFISIGDNSPLFRSYDFYFFGLVVLLILAIAADQFFRNKKSPQKQAKSLTNQ